MKCTDSKCTLPNLHLCICLRNLHPRQDIEHKVGTVKEGGKDWSFTVSLETVAGASVVTAVGNHPGSRHFHVHGDLSS